MLYKEKLVAFIKLKDKIVKKEINIKYIDKRDIKDIRKWDEKTCEEIYKQLISSIYEGSYGMFNDTCIWCIKYRYHYTYDECKKCEYGKNHGLCRDLYTNYSIYRSSNVDILSNNEYRTILKQIK